MAGKHATYEITDDVIVDANNYGIISVMSALDVVKLQRSLWSETLCKTHQTKEIILQKLLRHEHCGKVDTKGQTSAKT